MEAILLIAIIVVLIILLLYPRQNVLSGSLWKDADTGYPFVFDVEGNTITVKYQTKHGANIGFVTLTGTYVKKDNTFVTTWKTSSTTFSGNVTVATDPWTIEKTASGVKITTPNATINLVKG